MLIHQKTAEKPEGEEEEEEEGEGEKKEGGSKTRKRAFCQYCGKEYSK